MTRAAPWRHERRARALDAHAGVRADALQREPAQLFERDDFAIERERSQETLHD
jgi:hypothetical protein